MRNRKLVAASALVSAMLAVTTVAREAPSTAGTLHKSGTVRLEVTCDADVKEDFQTALALLHSFFYAEARRRFEQIALTRTIHEGVGDPPRGRSELVV